MTISKRLLGGISGLILGAIVTTILAYIAMSLFYKGGGFVIDIGPILILVNGVLWGAISGAIVGVLMLSRLKSLLTGLVSAFGALTLLFLANVAEDGFAAAASSIIKSLSSGTGVYCFIVITAFSAFVIGAFNQAVIDTKNAKARVAQANSELL